MKLLAQIQKTIFRIQQMAKIVLRYKFGKGNFGFLKLIVGVHQASEYDAKIADYDQFHF